MEITRQFTDTDKHGGDRTRIEGVIRVAGSFFHGILIGWLPAQIALVKVNELPVCPGQESSTGKTYDVAQVLTLYGIFFLQMSDFSLA